jgi:hypothetical protein
MTTVAYVYPFSGLIILIVLIILYLNHKYSHTPLGQRIDRAIGRGALVLVGLLTFSLVVIVMIGLFVQALIVFF